MKTFLFTQFDTELNCNYDIYRFDSALGLSTFLKESYVSRGYDYTKFIDTPQFGYSKNKVNSAPNAVYEYQNFFLLTDENGDYHLLDGFRRLLWYDAPDIPILVRVYKKSDLTEQKILRLIMSLNQFKFYGIGSYYERGFSLLFESIFNINLIKLSYALNGYLNFENEKYVSYSSSESLLYEKAITRIQNEYFLADMRFLQDLINLGCWVPKYLGTALYKKRIGPESTTKIYSAEEFFNHCQKRSTFDDLNSKALIIGQGRPDGREAKIVTAVLDIFESVFDELSGKKVGKTCSELTAEYKETIKTLNKDKTLYALTRRENVYKAKQYILSNPHSEFVIVVLPNEAENIDETLHGVFYDGVVSKFINTLRFGNNIYPQISLNKNGLKYDTIVGEYVNDKFSEMSAKFATDKNPFGSKKNKVRIYLKVDPEISKNF